MKKFLSFTVLAAAALQFAPMASAQEADVEIIPPANDIYTHDWKTNWYIQLSIFISIIIIWTSIII